MIEFKLPSLGADMDQGKLLEWKVKPGDRVARGQVVAVVDTTKAAVDVESWQDGIVHQLLVQPDAVLPVGAPMMTLLAEGEAAPPPAPTIPAAAPAAVKDTPPAAAAAPAPRPAAGEGARQKVSPAARKRAGELHVDLARIGSGSGPDGAVSVADVERAATAAPQPTRAQEMRKTIAAAMSRSKREIPHYYLAETIPLRHAVDWLAAQNAQRPLAQRILMPVLLLKAVAVTLKKFPELNGHYRDGAYQPAPAVHLGVAIALRSGGLVAPAIHDVPDRTLDDLMRLLDDLIQRTRAGSLRSSELADGTVTVTSLGDQGVELVQAVIYPPQVAMIGFGRIAERALALDGMLMAAPAVTASLSADHRVSDGHRGGLFLAALRDALQKPELLA